MTTTTETTHITSRGQEIPVRAMNDQHLLNAIAKMARDYPVLDEFCGLLLEVEHRGLYPELRERLVEQQKGPK